MSLDFMPSPASDRPGLLIRDPYHFSDAMLIVPPPLVECLQCFDGEQTDLDLRESLVRITGELDVGQLEKHLIETLSASGFLEDETFERMREERTKAFAELPVRAAAHSGAAYPEDTAELRGTLDRYMSVDGNNGVGAGKLVGIAAPHVSPEGGWRSYGAAYRALGPELRDRTFVVLGTSHYGEPERFGLTRKPFATPYGTARTDTALVDRLEAAGGNSVAMEDYCHSFEHTIELQVIFLQHLYGPDVRIVPVLCGQFARSLYEGGRPEDDDGVRRFFGALGDLAASEGDRLFWILGIDMAHMGQRYGDRFPATADHGEMQDVAERDQARIERVNAADAEGFWERVQERRDDLKWCGAAPVYTFLRAGAATRGELLRYEQWNIDPHSVVSFAGMGFYK
jgi:AmmeMemoRadiSam system protein B